MISWVTLKRPSRLIILNLLALITYLLNINFTGGLTLSEGDRITIIALPILLVAFVLAITALKGSLEPANANATPGRDTSARGG